jgi:hypothetical protein
MVDAWATSVPPAANIGGYAVQPRAAAAGFNHEGTKAPSETILPNEFLEFFVFLCHLAMPRQQLR